MSYHSQGIGVAFDGITHYVKWTPYEHAKERGYWNSLSWCSYELTPDTPSGVFIRCHSQRGFDGTIITCIRCSTRDPKDRRPWG